MRLVPLLCIVVLLGWAGPAWAFPFGPSAEVGLAVTPKMEQGLFTLHSMSGPVAQVGFQVGDWFNNQFLFQFSNVSGGVDYHGLPLSGSVNVQMLLGGYQLTLDIGGKQGFSGFTPFLGGGLMFGTATVVVRASSTDPSVEAALERDQVAVQKRAGPVLELHGVAGVRYRAFKGLGVLAEVGYSTYGGFLGTWEPKLGVDYTF